MGIFALDGGGIGEGRRRSVTRSAGLTLAVLGSAATLTLFWLAL